MDLFYISHKQDSRENRAISFSANLFNTGRLAETYRRMDGVGFCRLGVVWQGQEYFVYFKTAKAHTAAKDPAIRRRDVTRANPK